MKISDWLASATSKLNQAGIGTSRLDSLILLEDQLGQERAWILAHPEQPLNDEHIKKLDAKLNRRTRHEPLAYIRGKSEFFGHELIVSADTLEPRPETETIIELLLKLNSAKDTIIVDVGTGSGAIAISAKLELPNSIVLATEINSKALAVAKQNAKKLNADITFFYGDLLRPIPHTLNPNIILANLPYVPDGHTINQAAMFEPRIAIFGGPDGLDYYRQMFSQINDLGNRPTYVITEALPPQHKLLERVAVKAGYSLIESQDFIQIFTVRVGLRA